MLAGLRSRDQGNPALALALCLALAIALLAWAARPTTAQEPLDGLVPGLPLDPQAPELGGDLPSHDYGERKMRRGDTGTDVEKLQRLLTRLGLETKANGHFGKATEKSVKRDERRQQRNVNGVVSRPHARDIRRRVKPGGHSFPVRGAYDFGGDGSRYGAPRPGHTHKGQDVAAAYGTPLVAVHDGVVATRQYQAGGAGNYVVIRGDDDSDSVYMHMRDPALVSSGERVRSGQVIGNVGSTGSSTGPHLHFELWTPHWYAGGYAYDPLPKLRHWAK